MRPLHRLGIVILAVLDADGDVRVCTEGTSPDVSRVVAEVRAAGLAGP